MHSKKAEFYRKLGCLRIMLQHLRESLRQNDFSGIESNSKNIQEMLLDLIKMQRLLTRPEQTSLRPRFQCLREEALHQLEIARRILDDSLEAMLILIKTVQDAGGYPVRRVTDSSISVAGTE